MTFNGTILSRVLGRLRSGTTSGLFRSKHSAIPTQNLRKTAPTVGGRSFIPREYHHNQYVPHSLNNFEYDGSSSSSSFGLGNLHWNIFVPIIFTALSVTKVYNSTPQRNGASSSLFCYDMLIL